MQLVLFLEIIGQGYLSLVEAIFGVLQPPSTGSKERWGLSGGVV